MENLKELMELSLKSCDFISIPDVIYRLPKLKVLVLKDDAFPDKEIEKLTKRNIEIKPWF
jgi:hypothetical protein